MTTRFDPEGVDLASVARFLRESHGSSFVGEVMGRTQMRDEVLRHLGCSELEGETLIDTMINRGFLVRRQDSIGGVEWIVKV